MDDWMLIYLGKTDYTFCNYSLSEDNMILLKAEITISI